MNNLYRKTIRLAHQDPELRVHLLPLLKKAQNKFLQYLGTPAWQRVVNDVVVRFADDYDHVKSFNSGIVWLSDPKGSVRSLAESFGLGKLAREIKNRLVEYFMEQYFNASEQYSSMGYPGYEMEDPNNIDERLANFYDSSSQKVEIEFVVSPRTGVSGIKFILSTPVAVATKRLR